MFIDRKMSILNKNPNSILKKLDKLILKFIGKKIIRHFIRRRNRGQGGVALARY